MSWIYPLGIGSQPFYLNQKGLEVLQVPRSFGLDEKQFLDLMTDNPKLLTFDGYNQYSCY